jgi:hypothetical protein
MTLNQAHDIACRALGSDPRVRKLMDLHGDALYSSLLPPRRDTGGQWVELVLLGSGQAKFVDDPRGQSVVLARCLIDPASGHCQVLVEEAAEPGVAPDCGGIT